MVMVLFIYGTPTILFSDAVARTCIFLGRFFCARKQAFYGRTILDFILPVSVVLSLYRGIFTIEY